MQKNLHDLVEFCRKGRMRGDSLLKMSVERRDHRGATEDWRKILAKAQSYNRTNSRCPLEGKVASPRADRGAVLQRG